MRRVGRDLVAVALTGGLPRRPTAALTFQPCVRELRRSSAARLAVPLDRAGAVPGTVKLHVERLQARGKREGALIALAGGPGQAATPFLIDWAGTFFAAVRRTATWSCSTSAGPGCPGCCAARSSRCRSTRTRSSRPSAPPPAPRRSGPRRAFYTTRDSVEDLEAVRQAIGVERIALFGVSYGTKVALAYAARYPQHVERLVLDSVVELDGPGAFSQREPRRDPARAAALCARRAASDITPDPVADLAALVQRMRARASSTGRSCRRRDGATVPGIGSVRLLDLLFAGDFDPTLRARPPGRGALGADAATPPRSCASRCAPSAAARTVAGRVLQRRRCTPPPVCEEGPLPWDAHDARAPRAAAGRGARCAALPAAALDPFDRTTALFASPIVQLCSRWPTAPAPEPALRTARFPPCRRSCCRGEDDLRTPLESARRIAARIPGASARLGARDGPLRARAGSRARAGCARWTTSSADVPLRKLPAAAARVPARCPIAPALAVRRSSPQRGVRRARRAARCRAVALTLDRCRSTRSSPPRCSPPPIRTCCTSAACAPGTRAPACARSSCTVESSVRASACRVERADVCG